MKAIIYGFGIAPNAINELINEKIIEKKLWIGERKNPFVDYKVVDIDNLKIPIIKHSYSSIYN